MEYQFIDILCEGQSEESFIKKFQMEQLWQNIILKVSIPSYSEYCTAVLFSPLSDNNSIIGKTESKKKITPNIMILNHFKSIMFNSFTFHI